MVCRKFVPSVLLDPLKQISVLTFLFFLMQPSHAASVCYSEKYFPSVVSLTAEGDEILVQLGGVYARGKSAPVLSWSTIDSWKLKGAGKCQNCPYNYHGGKCGTPIPSWPPGQIDDWQKSSEEPSICALSADAVYFGIDYYEGEGYTGNAGFGRLDRQTGKLEIRRPYRLPGYPVFKVVWDGQNIWGATTKNLECLGHPPAAGLVRYNWVSHKVTTFTEESEGPCGFVIDELLFKEPYLWVGTDLGISRLDTASGKWTHFLPDLNNPAMVEEGSCTEFYKKLLKVIPDDERWFDEGRSYRQIFEDNLKQYRPGLYRELKLD